MSRGSIAENVRGTPTSGQIVPTSAPMWEKRVNMAKHALDPASFPEELKKQYQDAQARLDTQRLSGKPGVQTDGTLYWMNGNGKQTPPLIETEDFGGYSCNKNEASTGVNGNPAPSFGSWLRENEIATTTTNGTRVSAQSIPVSSITGVAESVVKLLNIETRQGARIQMELSRNVRITDQEDGSVSLYFPDTGETRRFDAEGGMTVERGETSGALEGTDGDDVLVNVNAARVDGGDGNDTVFNFSDNTVINGGDGDDNIILAGVNTNVIVNTGAGNNGVQGNMVHSSVINAEGEHDSLGFYGLRGSVITSENKLNFDGYDIKDSKFEISASVEADIGGLTNSQFIVEDKQADKSKVSLNIGSLNNSSLFTGSGDDTINVTGIHESRVVTGGGNDFINTAHVYNSAIDMGDGDDTLLAVGLHNASISMGGGDDTVVVDSGGGRSTIDTGDGSDTVYYTTLDGVRLNLDASKDKVYHAAFGAIHRLHDDPTTENWNKMIDIAHRYDKTALFKGYKGDFISLLLGANSLSSPRS